MGPWTQLQPTGRERSQRENSTLTSVVGTQHVGHVLDRDDERQRPEHQRHDAEHVVRARRNAVRPIETLADSVERACPDIAEHDAQRSQRQGLEAAVVRWLVLSAGITLHPSEKQFYRTS